MPATSKEIVILLHGMGHSKWHMLGTELAMQKAGYDTCSITYPSLCLSLHKLAIFLHKKLREEEIWSRYERVHFVTHSMGGLVTREYLEAFKHKFPKVKLGRVVMMAPPLGGSDVADVYRSLWPYKIMFGPAGQELASEVQAQRQKNINPYYDLGVIAGSVGWPYFLGSIALSGSHDGRVPVDKTKTEGMKDHIVLALTHDFIPWTPRVHKLALRFLKAGTFS